MRVSNYREPKTEDSTIVEQNKSTIDLKLAATGEHLKDESLENLDNFALEDIPTKMILVDQKYTENTHLIVYHNGKPHFPCYLIRSSL